MSLVNANYCRPSADALSIEYAPVIFPPSPHEPTEADYLAHGWYRNETHNPPMPPEGKMVASKRFVVRNSKVVAEYTYAPIPPHVRTFSKYRLVSALMAEGVWAQVKAWIEAKEGAYDLYIAAEDISEDEPLFISGRDALASALGWDAEKVESILSAAEVAP